MLLWKGLSFSHWFIMLSLLFIKVVYLIISISRVFFLCFIDIFPSTHQHRRFNYCVFKIHFDGGQGEPSPFSFYLFWLFLYLSFYIWTSESGDFIFQFFFFLNCYLKLCGFLCSTCIKMKAWFRNNPLRLVESSTSRMGNASLFIIFFSFWKMPGSVFHSSVLYL